jgi:hypothetical protein
MSNKPELIKEILDRTTKEAVIIEDFDEALIGISHGYGREALAAYSYDGCVRILMERDGMAYDEAVDFMEYNIISLGAEGAPCFIQEV